MSSMNVHTFCNSNGHHCPESFIFKQHLRLEIGAEEYLDSGSICLIEWSEKIQPLLPQELHRVKLEYIDQNTRKIEFS